MSRASLVSAAKRVGVSTVIHSRGRSGPKNIEALRIDLINRTYGPGLHFRFPDATAADETIVRAVDTALGGNGYLLSLSQAALRNANEERTEYKRLTGLKRRRPKDEAGLLKSAGQWLHIARIAQGLHEVQSGCGNAA